MAAPVPKIEDTNRHRSQRSTEECEWKQGESAVGNSEGRKAPPIGSRPGKTDECKSKPAACGSVEDFDLPLSRFPLRGKAGAGGFPPRRKHATRQQKALARIAAAGSPHKRGCRPLVYPPRAHWWNQGGSINPDSSFRQNMNFSVDTTSLLMEAATVRKRSPGPYLPGVPGVWLAGTGAPGPSL